MYRRFLSFTLIVILSLGVAIAQQPVATNAPDIERLQAHIEYLASDKLTGRRTGTPGANLAAEYIAREFSRLGLRRSIGHDTAGMSILEADSPKRYQQEFPYVAGVELGKNNTLTINKVSLDAPEPQGTLKTLSSESIRGGQDWMPLGFSKDSEIRGATLAFAGYGISSAELNYDDYAIAHARGNFAVVFAGTPDGDNPHGQFARAGQIRFKVAAATAAGARALLIIANEERLADDRLSRLSYDNAGETGIPVLVISRQLARKLLTLGTLKEYQEVADSRTLAEQEKHWNKNNAFYGPPARFLRVLDAHQTIDLLTDVNRHEVSAANVIGILDGSDPTLKNETIVIGAHYDHLGHGGEGSLAPREGEIHHGADDNASGVAGMLELARLFTSPGQRPRRTIVFIAFSGEEEGLLGSNYYVNHPVVPLANTVAMLNMDMIGRMKNNKLIIGGVGTTPGWRETIADANAAERYKVTAAPESPSDTSGSPSATSGSSSDSSRSPMFRNAGFLS